MLTTSPLKSHTFVYDPYDLQYVYSYVYNSISRLPHKRCKYIHTWRKLSKAVHGRNEKATRIDKAKVSSRAFNSKMLKCRMYEEHPIKWLFDITATTTIKSKGQSAHISPFTNAYLHERVNSYVRTHLGGSIQ